MTNSTKKECINALVTTLTEPKCINKISIIILYGIVIANKENSNSKKTRENTIS